MALWLILLLPVEPATDHVHTVEINRFGDGSLDCVIYRDHHGEIIDWRWKHQDALVPRWSRPGRYLASWEDKHEGQVRLRQVTCERVIYTRTAQDVEVFERQWLPDHLRRKLSR